MATEMTMDELPDLPFKQILSHLSVEEIIKSRAVSRAWYHRINSFRVKSLSFSEYPFGIIFLKKPGLINGSYHQNFISSARFASFFNTFSQTILSNVKHLNLCALDLNKKDRIAFPGLLNSFGQLEKLEIIWFEYHPHTEKAIELNLPMLYSIHLEQVKKISRLTLDAPCLKGVELNECSNLRLDLIHTQPVERLLVDRLEYTPVKKLKSLKQIYIKDDPANDPTLLSDLKQLKEVHLLYPDGSSKVSEFFEQKQRYGLTDLKIYFHGLLLSGADDPEIGSLGDWYINLRLAENSSRLADEIPFIDNVQYWSFESIAPAKTINYLKRFTDLKRIYVYSDLVENVQNFLNLLKHLDNLSGLLFFGVHQELFDRLPAYSAIQWLEIDGTPADFQFLFRLQNLIYLNLDCSVEAKTVGKLLKELQYLWNLEFKFKRKKIEIITKKKKALTSAKQFKLLVNENYCIVADANAVVQFLLKLHRKNGKHKSPRVASGPK